MSNTIIDAKLNKLKANIEPAEQNVDEHVRGGKGEGASP